MQILFKNNRGMVLVVLIMMMMILLSITGASLLFSRLNLKTAAAYKTGGTVFQIADAGIAHARAVIPMGGDFDALLQGDVSAFPCSTPCNGSSNKPTLTGSLAGSTYSVVVMDDDDGGSGNTYIDDTNKIVVLISTAKGPNNSQRSVVAYIQKENNNAPPGAVYIPGDIDTQPKFKTKGSFFITGDDTSYTDNGPDGWADIISAGPEPSVLGIALGDANLSSKFVSSLDDAERALVQGEGYDGSTTPATPSIAIPSTNIDVAEVANFYRDQISPSAGCPPWCNNGLKWDANTPCDDSNPCTLGTDSAPQVTYIKQAGKQHAHLSGKVSGAGVLILEGKGHIQGDFEFHGIVISVAPGSLEEGGVDPDEDVKFSLKKNAKIFGSLILGPNQDKLQFDIKDNARVYYSSQALDMVDSNLGGELFWSIELTGWREVMD